MVHRVAFATGRDPYEVYRSAYARVLYSFFFLDLWERQSEARRAVEGEELVNGISYAFNDPTELTKWSRSLRRRVNLEEAPKAERDVILKMTEALERGVVTPIRDPAAETIPQEG